MPLGRRACGPSALVFLVDPCTPVATRRPPTGPRTTRGRPFGAGLELSGVKFALLVPRVVRWQRVAKRGWINGVGGCRKRLRRQSGNRLHDARAFPDKKVHAVPPSAPAHRRPAACRLTAPLRSWYPLRFSSPCALGRKLTPPYPYP